MALYVCQAVQNGLVRMSGGTEWPCTYVRRYRMALYVCQAIQNGPVRVSGGTEWPCTYVRRYRMALYVSQAVQNDPVRMLGGTEWPCTYVRPLFLKMEQENKMFRAQRFSALSVNTAEFKPFINL